MALVVKDRVQVTSTTTGTGTFTLGSAVAGFQDFSAIGNGNTTYYAIVGGAEWEVGLGTYTSSGTTLSRDTILESSNGGTAVNFSAGTKNVFVTYPAEKGLYVDASGNAIALGTPASATLTNATGLPISTGVSGLGTNVATFLATPTSANLAAALTDETGTGANVFATSPTVASPTFTSQSTFAAGTAAAPAITTTGDTNTGIFFPAADTIAFSEGGTESMRIDSSGNVAIGANTASYKLETVANNPTRGIISQFYNNAGSGQTGTQVTFLQEGIDWWTIGQPAATSSFSFWSSRYSGADGTLQMSITNTGNLQFNSGYGSVATAYGCRAWVNFNGTGTIAIRSSGNVTSIGDGGAGKYTVNFTNAMPDGNYSVAGIVQGLSGDENYGLIIAPSTTPATSNVVVWCHEMSTNTANADSAYVCVNIFR